MDVQRAGEARLTRNPFRRGHSPGIDRGGEAKTNPGGTGNGQGKGGLDGRYLAVPPAEPQAAGLATMLPTLILGSHS